MAARDEFRQSVQKVIMERIKDILDRHAQEVYDSLREEVADDVEAYDLPTSELADKCLLALLGNLWDYLTDKRLIGSELVRLVTSQQEAKPSDTKEETLIWGDLLE